MEGLTILFRFIQDTNFVILLYELLICLSIMKKRRFFYVRALVFIPYVVLTNNVIGIVDSINQFLVFEAFHFGYVLYFLVSVLLMWFCFAEKFSHILYFCTAAYIIENFGSQIGNIINLLFFDGSSVVDIYNEIRPPFYYIIREILEIPILLTVMFVFVNRYRKNYDFHVKTVSIVMIESFTLLIIIFLNYYATMRGYMNVVARIYAAIVDVTLLLFQFAVFSETRLQFEANVTEELLKIQARQQQLSKESIEIINVKCHDLKRQIAALRLVGDQAEREKAIHELESAAAFYDSIVTTGNEAIDIILMEKLLACKRNGITFSCIADGALLHFISPTDIYILFSNALDNAIESVMKAPPSKRDIVLQIERKGAFVRVLMENYCDDAVTEFADGLPVTSKQDRAYHGYGTKSIRMIAQKYGGFVTMMRDGTRFIVKIAFPFRAEPASRQEGEAQS